MSKKYVKQIRYEKINEFPQQNLSKKYKKVIEECLRILGSENFFTKIPMMSTTDSTKSFQFNSCFFLLFSTPSNDSHFSYVFLRIINTLKPYITKLNIYSNG